MSFLHFRLAIKYMKHLQYLLSFAPGQRIPQHIVEFDPSKPAWRKTANNSGSEVIIGLYTHLYYISLKYDFIPRTTCHTLMTLIRAVLQPQKRTLQVGLTILNQGSFQSITRFTKVNQLFFRDEFRIAMDVIFVFVLLLPFFPKV